MRQAGSLSNGCWQKESLSGCRPCVQAALGSADRRFHLRIAEFTGDSVNTVLLHMVSAMRAHLSRVIDEFTQAWR
ncbi:hypothetical protein [Burkholderia ubonensis]|uniref:hypothetical protein n=1 Tax=Burkholderia ubonensis TaxID=101571 RepID=UPI000A786A36|nr:hypothetical protein [Burkholderia ubonensis]